MNLNTFDFGFDEPAREIETIGTRELRESLQFARTHNSHFALDGQIAEIEAELTRRENPMYGHPVERSREELDAMIAAENAVSEANRARHAAELAATPNPYQTYCVTCAAAIPNNQGEYCSRECC